MNFSSRASKKREKIQRFPAALMHLSWLSSFFFFFFHHSRLAKKFSFVLSTMNLTIFFYFDASIILSFELIYFYQTTRTIQFPLGWYTYEVIRTRWKHFSGSLKTRDFRSREEQSGPTARLPVSWTLSTSASFSFVTRGTFIFFRFSGER